MEKVTAVRCKHGILEGTCSLCLGYPQKEAPLYTGGLPSWWVGSTQMAIRSNFGFRGGVALSGSHSIYRKDFTRGSRQDTKSKRQGPVKRKNYYKE